MPLYYYCSFALFLGLSFGLVLCLHKAELSSRSHAHFICSLSSQEILLRTIPQSFIFGQPCINLSVVVIMSGLA